MYIVCVRMCVYVCVWFIDKKFVYEIEKRIIAVMNDLCVCTCVCVCVCV